MDGAVVLIVAVVVIPPVVEDAVVVTETVVAGNPALPCDAKKFQMLMLALNVPMVMSHPGEGS